MRATRRALMALALLALAAGCGSGKARVKGRLVENGQPQKFGATQVALEFVPLGADGKPEQGKSYTAVVNEDGTFEVVASGGELPPGTYQVAVTAMGTLRTKYRAFAAPTSAIRREIKAGKNDLTIDLAKPEG
jgi:hypothetical protein